MPTNKAFVSALRAVADFMEQHPALVAPQIPYLCAYNVEAEALKAMAMVPGIHKEKEYSGDSFYLKAQIPYDAEDGVSTVNLIYQGARSGVCKRKVVGTKVVPEEYVPGYTRAQYTEEIVEWECEPLTAPSEAEETS